MEGYRCHSTFNIAINDEVGLKGDQLAQVQAQMNAIYGQTTDANGNSVSLLFVTSNSDYSITLENSAWYKPGSWGGNIGATSASFGVAFGSSSVYVDKIAKLFSGADVPRAIGSVGAHELDHRITSSGHSDDAPNLMYKAADKNITTPAPAFGTRLTRDQIADLFKKCQKLHPPNTQDEFGNPWDPFGGWDPFDLLTLMFASGDGASITITQIDTLMED